MRPLILFGIVLRLSGQETPAPAATDAKTDAAKENASPVPSAESWFTGSIDLGYRWRTDVGGSFDTYRSIVNLGSVPKLLGAELTITDPKHPALDRMDVRAYNLGDDPYATFHLSANKARLYDFNADYRDIAYFNFLPSYADPLLARGAVLTSNPSMSAAGLRVFNSISCQETGSSRTWPMIAIRDRGPAPPPL